MHPITRLTSIVLITLSCLIFTLFQTIKPGLTNIPEPVFKSPSATDIAQNLNFGRHFQDLGIEGSIVIYDATNDRLWQHNPQRNTTAFLPASTFKILNSLISLETGVINDEIAVLTWDGISRMLPEWNRDLNMREAMKLSAVWFYQVLARRVGYDRMQQWVTQVGYGNQNIGGKDNIDNFWLQGELRITPQEQIQFLQRLATNNLPFSARSLSIVKDIMTVEKTPDYTIRAKTGLTAATGNATPSVGWYVGYLERGNNTYFFATNINVRNPSDLANRLEVTRRCLQDLQLL